MITITWRIPSWVLLMLAVAILATAAKKTRKPIPYVRITEAQPKAMLAGQSIMTPLEVRMQDILASHQTVKDRLRNTINRVDQLLGAR